MELTKTKLIHSGMASHFGETMLKLDWGDSQVWMTIAVELHNNKPTTMGPHRAPSPYRYPKENELNVACVCAGYAFELIFKVLVCLSGQRPQPKHEPSVAYSDISQIYRVEIVRIGRGHGWNDINALLKFLDDSLCQVDRKYWGRSPERGEARVTFHIGGPRSQLHEELSDFALDAINKDHNVHEIWTVGKGKRRWLVYLA